MFLTNIIVSFIICKISQSWIELSWVHLYFGLSEYSFLRYDLNSSKPDNNIQPPCRPFTNHPVIFNILASSTTQHDGMTKQHTAVCMPNGGRSFYPSGQRIHNHGKSVIGQGKPFMYPYGDEGKNSRRLVSNYDVSSSCLWSKRAGWMSRKQESGLGISVVEIAESRDDARTQTDKRTERQTDS